MSAVEIIGVFEMCFSTSYNLSSSHLLDSQYTPCIIFFFLGSCFWMWAGRISVVLHENDITSLVIATFKICMRQQTGEARLFCPSYTCQLLQLGVVRHYWTSRKTSLKPLFFHCANMLRSTSSLKSTPEYIAYGMFVESLVVHWVMWGHTL